MPWPAVAVLCRGGAATVSVLLQWRCCYSDGDVSWHASWLCLSAVAVLLQWPCCAVACVVAVLQRSRRAVPWPAVAVLLQWRCCSCGGCSAGLVALKGCPFRILLL